MRDRADFLSRLLIVATALALGMITFVVGIFATIFSQGCGALCSEPDHPSIIRAVAVAALFIASETGIVLAAGRALKALDRFAQQA